MHKQMSDYKILAFQFGTLARMLQVDPPPKAVKVTMSKRIPLVGDELKAYEEEQERVKKEEALKASLSKEEELKASQGSNAKASAPMVVDASLSCKSSNGIRFFSLDDPNGIRWLHIFRSIRGLSYLIISHLQWHIIVWNIIYFLIATFSSSRKVSLTLFI
jgi:hypothetical protein